MRRGRHPVIKAESLRGFTLVELLVVIAVLAILIVLATSGFSAATRSGNSAKCLNHLRQLTTLYHLYTQENGGRLLASLERESGRERHDTTQEGNWQVNLEAVMRGSTTGAPRRLPELTCPSLPKLYRSQTNTSYAMNFHICEIHKTMPGPTTAARVAYPSQLVLFGDSQGISKERTQGTISFSSKPVDWHSAPNTPSSEQAANLGFFDGHVERVRISEIPSQNPRTGGGDSPSSRFWLGY